MFYVTDTVHPDECVVKYCSTDDMIAYYNTKPLVGNKFKVFRDLIMNLSGSSSLGLASRSVLDILIVD